MENFEKEYIKVLPLIKNICFKYKDNNLIELDDMIQEASIKIWNASKNFNGKSKFSYYVYVIVNNYCLTILRKTYSNNLINTIELNSIDYKLYINEIDKMYKINEEQSKLLWKKIYKLNLKEKKLIIGYLNYTPYKIISYELNMTIINVRVSILRIKKKLKYLILNDKT